MATISRIFAVLLIANFARSEPVVKSSLGTFTGTSETYNDSQVEAFRGIPYAKPPLGELRFAYPQPYGPVGDFKATKFGLACIQSQVLAEAAPPASEDCLHLNVFRKAGTKPDSKKAVIFVVHHGSFAMGTATSDFYNAIPITAIGDVIIVSIDYRLGVLGFADMKDLAPGNLGLYDQLLALQWVHDNIADFGGDPDKVTLLGDSAGAMSVSAILNTPLVQGKNLFKKVITDGGVMSYNNVLSQDESLQRVERIAAKVGCDTQGEKMLSCLRKANATELAVASLNPEFSPAWTFMPTIDKKFIPMNPTKDYLENSARFADVKLLTGVSKDEGTLFAVMYEASKTVKTEAEFIALCKDIARGFFYRIDLDDKKVRDALIETYFGKSANHFMDVSVFMGDGTFYCPINAFVKNYAKTHSNVYVYNFRRLIKQKIDIYDSEIMGVYHGAPFVHMFGTMLGNPATATEYPEDYQFSLEAVKMTTNFAKFDDPPSFQGITWPNYSKGEGILVIDNTSFVKPTFFDADRCQKVFPLYEVSQQ